MRKAHGIRRWLGGVFALVLLAGAAPASAQTLRIGAQKSGTFGWELAVIKARGLDKAAGLDLQITDLATTEAGKIAISGGSVDIILSDWLWVSRERGLGGKLTFTPYSSAIGAVMAKSAGPITTASRSASRGVRSTRAGCCFRPTPNAADKTSTMTPASSSARRRC